MATLGEALRSARQARGLSLAEIEAVTKIRRKYLVALESDDLAELPPPVYSRGYVRTFAIYVGLDPTAMAALYEEERPQGEVAGVQPEVRPPRAPSAITGRTLLALIILVAVGGVGYYLYQQYSMFVAGDTSRVSVRLPAGAAAGPTAAPVLAAGPTVEALATPSPPPTASPMPTATPMQGVHIEVRVTDRSWLDVSVDDQQVYRDNAKPGATFKWDGRDKIVMRTGNAAGVEVTFNGKPQGKLGALGEVKDIQWTAAR